VTDDQREQIEAVGVSPYGRVRAASARADVCKSVACVRACCRQGSFSSNECSPNRLSLPVGLLEHGAVDGNSCCQADDQQHECGPQFGGPWWVLTPVTMPAVDCACTSHDFMSHKAPLAPRPPPPPVPWTTATITEAASTPAVQNQNQQWAIAPYRSKELTKSTPALPVNGTPKTPRRRVSTLFLSLSCRLIFFQFQLRRTNFLSTLSLYLPFFPPLGFCCGFSCGLFL
jgi:hypothetical protein